MPAAAGVAVAGWAAAAGASAATAAAVGAVAAAAVTGAIVGGVIGAATALLTKGNILEGALKGALIGGVTGAAAGYLAPAASGVASGSTKAALETAMLADASADIGTSAAAGGSKGVAQVGSSGLTTATASGQGTVQPLGVAEQLVSNPGIIESAMPKVAPVTPPSADLTAAQILAESGKQTAANAATLGKYQMYSGVLQGAGSGLAQYMATKEKGNDIEKAGEIRAGEIARNQAGGSAPTNRAMAWKRITLPDWMTKGMPAYAQYKTTGLIGGA